MSALSSPAGGSQLSGPGSSAGHDLAEWVRAALASWPIHDQQQAKLRAAYLAHLDAHPDALWRDGPPAHLTASAFVLDPDHRKILLTLHRKGGFWVQFGGHLEPGDSSLSAAALREAVEESGIDDVEVLGPADLHRHELSREFGRCREHLDAAYVAIAPHGARPIVTSESLDVAWWPVDALPDDVVPDLPHRLERLLAR